MRKSNNAISHRAWIALMAPALVVLLTTALVLRLGRTAGAAPKPPNLVFIMADDLGAKELSCYGNREHETPHLDTLAHDGVRFRTCFATPLCHPTRLMLMTGQYGCHNGVYNFAGRRGGPRPTDWVENIANHRTFAQVLKTRGYATALAGKWQLSGKIPHLVHEAGFDEYCMWAYVHNLPPGVRHTGGWEGKGRKKTSRYWHPSILKNGKYVPTKPNDYGPDLFADFAIDFVRRHKQGPFFLYYPMALTHAPYYTTPDTTKSAADHFRHRKSNFKACVEYTDKLVGRIVKTLDELNIRDRTIVFFTGDNGTGGDGKGQPTERGARVPLIVNGPGRVKPGGASDALIDLSDILPTLAELAGAEVPKDRPIDGHSFAPILRGEKGPSRAWVFSYLADRRILRTRRWLLEDNSPLHPGRLYDCNGRRDGRGYRDVTQSSAPEVLATKKKFARILEQLPAPVLPAEGRAAGGRGTDETTINLAGPWAFRLDPRAVGDAEHWFERPLPDRIHLPGSLQEQGYGDPITVDTPWTGTIMDRSWFTEKRYAKYRRPGHVKVPFWLQPDKHYVGAAWYQREVTVPPMWTGRRIVLHLERPHWETRVWVDARQIGMRNSLATAHQYDLTDALAPSPAGYQRHRLTIRVDNTVKINVGVNAHSVTDQTQTNWNGIIGAIQLRSTDPVWIDDLQVYPHLAANRITVRGRIGNRTDSAGAGTLVLSVREDGARRPRHPRGQRIPIAWEATGKPFAVEYELGSRARPWDEFQPALYRLTAHLEGRDSQREYEDTRSTVFGMREVRASGTQFAINGHKAFLRGTLECCIFPRTGYPATDVAAWKRIIRICKAHGLNHMRFHSWCPPEAAFVAADALGFYYQVECGAWTQVGTGQSVDQWLYDEGVRITRVYGNHPSFLLMAYGNEPGGPQRGARYLRKWCTFWKQRDPRRLYTSAAGHPLIAESDYNSTPVPRIQSWGAGRNSVINARPPQTRFDYRDFVKQHAGKPTISHEIGQWCVYPNFAEISKYRGTLKAKNFEIFRDSLAAHHMADQARDFLLASGKLQTLCYKAEIEAALRTPGLGGFQLLDLHDFPGQGTALVGVLDPFWDAKPYVSATEYRRFCNTTVPLARMDRRVWRHSDTLTADVEVAHFGAAALRNAQLNWKLVDTQGKNQARGGFGRRNIPLGNGIALGQITCPLAPLVAPARYKLVVSINNTPFANDWDLWVYPDKVDTGAPADVLVTSQLDRPALDALRGGGKVLLLVEPKRVRGGVAIGFSSVFWNTAWTRGQPPHTLGILCDPKHPVFAHFPTQCHSNWQWWELIHGSGAMVLDDLPARLRPLVQPIHTWFENRRLGLLLEARVAGGKLMVCSMDLTHDLDHRIVARQFRHSLLGYMHSAAFQPAVDVAADRIRAL